MAQAEYQQALTETESLQAQLLQQGFGQADFSTTSLRSTKRSCIFTAIIGKEFTKQLVQQEQELFAYSQALRDAPTTSTTFYQEPYTRLGILGSGIASQAGGVPTTTQTQARHRGSS